MEEKEVALWQHGTLVLKAHQADVREKIEDMLLEKLGYTPMLQESAEDEEYEIYLHTDTYEDLDDKQIDELTSLGITEDGEATTSSLQALLDVTFEIVGDWVTP